MSRLAIGDKQASATSATYRVLQVESQMRYVEGTPLGLRGAIAVAHNFPADGDYKFTSLLQRTISGELFGNTGIAIAGSNGAARDFGQRRTRRGARGQGEHGSLTHERGFEIDTPPIP